MNGGVLEYRAANRFALATIFISENPNPTDPSKRNFEMNVAAARLSHCDDLNAWAKSAGEIGITLPVEWNRNGNLPKGANIAKLTGILEGAETGSLTETLRAEE